MIESLYLIMRQLNISVDSRPCVKAALAKRDISNTVSMALELKDGTIVDAKTIIAIIVP